MPDMKCDDETYVVAVSGGVDSVVLLDMLVKAEDKKLIVAHYDHGIRQDSYKDREFVAGLANTYGLEFVYEEGNLGATASEATARKARYDFLRRIKIERQAARVVTAHHEDDVLETAVLNLLRGTGRKGLSSLRSTEEIYRPLLGTSKQTLINYAKTNRLSWREDPTNKQQKYLRNYVRQSLLPKLSDTAREQFRTLVIQAREQNFEIDNLLTEQLGVRNTAHSLNRHWFLMLPHAVALEIMAAWLRASGVADFDRRSLQKLVTAAKTFATGRRTDVNKSLVLEIQEHDLVLVRR